MKKLVLLCAFIIFPLLLWAQSGRTIIPVDSELYRLVDLLRYESGMAEAESARPWTAAEFESSLEKIDYDKLSRAGKNTYDYILTEIMPTKVLLEEEHLKFDASVKITPEAFVHFELEDSEEQTDSEYEWTHGYEERQSFLSVPLEFWYDESLYMILELEAKEEYMTVDCTECEETADNNFNVLFDDPTIRIDSYFPFRAVTSLGGEWWDFYFGRDNLSWGNGKSGNLVLSDYSDFYDFLMLKLRSDTITFSSVCTMMNYYQPDDTAALISHRLDFSFFDERLRLTLMESDTLTDDGWEFIRNLNFLMIYHNWNTPGVANSMLSVEASVNPWKYFNIYGQIAMDEFTTPYEDERDGGGGPPIFGYLAGASGAVPLGEGYLDLTFEWVLTSPWLYNNSDAPYYYNTRRYWSFVTDSFVEICKATGYEYGPDSIVYYFDASYSVAGSFSAGLNLTWLTQGELDLGSAWAPEDETTPTGTPEYTFIMNLNGDYKLLPFLSFGADVYWISTLNNNNVEGAVRNDLEFAANIIFDLSADTLQF